MAIIIHGPGVRDPYPLERRPEAGGPAATQPTAAVRPVQEEEAGAAAQAAARLRAAIDATREWSASTARSLRAGELMQEGAHVLKVSTSLGEAREALHRWGVREAAVVDEEGLLVGLLEERDLLRALWPPGGAPRSGVGALSVGEVCRRPVDAVRGDAPLGLVVRLMLERDDPALPVVDEAGRPLGLIRMAGLLRLVLAATRMEDWA